MTTLIEGIEGVKALAGRHLGYSEWHEVTQEQVDRFADATGDHQWIHVDPERAARESPFGGPVAHGYLTLALAPVLLSQIMRVSGITYGLNYGCNKVRFVSPVPVGAKVRAGAKVASVDEVQGGVQSVVEITFEIDGREKPACVAEVVYRYYA